MAEKQPNTNEILLDDFVTTPYKYGFTTNIETESFPKGLNLNILSKSILFIYFFLIHSLQ